MSAPVSLRVALADRSWAFGPTATVHVGRDPMCDVVVDDERVSRRHGHLRRDASGWTWTDTSSRGTYVAGQRCGDVRIVGAVELRLGAVDGPRIGLDPGSGPVLPAPSPPAVGAAAGMGTYRASIPLGAVTTVGREADNDVVVRDDLTVSRHHARLVRRGATTLVEDLGSMHGTFVDGVAVGAGGVRVSDGSAVRVGATVFRVVGGSLEEYADDAVTLAAHGVTVDLRGGARLLDAVSLVARPGELVAVLGPSGAGKTTLLGALSGAARPGGGTVAYNGTDLYASLGELRHRIGVVPQDDILHTSLPLRKALSFAAELRFAPDAAAAEREARVDEVLAELGLTDRAHVRIQDLSGGQRKRASVALELLTRPALLLLDEPTSGLDPGYERSVMELLRDLADGGRTVIVITHAVASLGLCDRVAYMAAGGRLAFFGPPSDALAYFGAADEADVFRRLDTGDVDWAQRFAHDPAHEANVAAPLRAAASASPQQARATPVPSGAHGRTRGQTATLLRRNVAVLVGMRGYLALLMLQAPLMGLLVILALGSGNLGGRGQARALLMVLVLAAVAIGLVNASREIVRELAVYRRERAVGLSLGAYMGAKAVFLGVLTAIQCGVLALIVLPWQSPLAEPLLFGATFLELGVILFFTAFAAVALGLAVSALVSTDAAALVMVPVLIVAQLVLANAFLDVGSKPVLSQLAWTAPSAWGFSAAAASVDLLVVENRCAYRDQLETRPDLPQGRREQARSLLGNLPCDPAWTHAPANVVLPLGMLALLAAAYLGAAALALRRRDAG